MPLETIRSRTRSQAPELALPPPFTLVTLREVGDAFAHATSIAAERGAGTLVYVGRFDLAEFAVVLEPDEPLRSARRTLYLGMAALADALAAHAPPEKPIAIDWPDAIRVDNGLVGGGRLGWPADASEDEPPAWMVFSAMIRTVAMGEGEPGLNPLSAALEDEGFESGSAALVESFSRHLMVLIDAWQEQGFGIVARSFLPRVHSEQGVHRAIDENGDLLVRHAGKGGVARRVLLPALAAPSWLDPQTGGPRV
jgi:hypothetical protein